MSKEVKQLTRKIEDYKRFLERQIMGAEAQIDNHAKWLEQGYVSKDHLKTWKVAKNAYQEALYTFMITFDLLDE